MHDVFAYISLFLSRFRLNLLLNICNRYVYIQSLARGVGRGFVPGLERAIDEAGVV